LSLSTDELVSLKSIVDSWLNIPNWDLQGSIAFRVFKKFSGF
jgi:hypothetical protein